MTSGQNGGQNRGQNERLRSLLAEAWERCGFASAIGLRARIADALAEPVAGCLRCYALGELRVSDQRKNDELYAELRSVYVELHAARSESAQLRKLVDQCEEAFEAIQRANHARGHAAADEMLALIEASK